MEFEAELRARAPFDGRSVLEFLGRRAIAGVERVSDSEYRRTVALDGRPGLLAVVLAGGDRLRVRAELDGRAHFDRAIDCVRRIFDLEADPIRTAAALGEDSLLSGVVRDHPGLRVPGCWDGFELAVRAVLGQQVTVRGASTLAARLVEAYGERLEDGIDGLTHLFPAPGTLMNASLDEVGLPRARAQTLRDLAGEVASGRVSLEPDTDPEELHRSITAIRGIGDWTAQYVAMRALKHADAFPAGDLVLRRAACEGPATPSARQLEDRSQAWRPWRAYAAIYLWKSVTPPDGGPES